MCVRTYLSCTSWKFQGFPETPQTPGVVSQAQMRDAGTLGPRITRTAGVRSVHGGDVEKLVMLDSGQDETTAETVYCGHHWGEIFWLL